MSLAHAAMLCAGCLSSMLAWELVRDVKVQGFHWPRPYSDWVKMNIGRPVPRYDAYTADDLRTMAGRKRKCIHQPASHTAFQTRACG
jgi:hypothetical protein